MANKRFFAGILVMALVFGITVIACDNGSTDNTDSANTDPALNGTWIASGMELKLDNGKFEVSSGGNSVYKGTYTTKDGSFTLTTTHIWGKTVYSNLEAKWYSKADLKAVGLSEAQLNEWFASQTGTYSVTSTTLTVTYSGGGKATYTKKQ